MVNVSEVLDIESNFSDSKDLSSVPKGTLLHVLSMKTKDVESVGAPIAELHCKEGDFHTYGKVVVGQVGSEHWQFALEKCLEKDASDGMNAWVTSKTATGSGKEMVALSMWEVPKP